VAGSISIAGGGFIGSVHALAAQELSMPVTAIASRTPEANADKAKSLRSRSVGYDELPAGADVVVVATPPWRHFDDAMAALNASAGVLLEKPMVRTLAEADQLCAAGGDRIAYGENLLFAPLVVDVVRRSRALGTLRHLEVRTLQDRPGWGDFFTAQWGGGALFDLGIHPIAIAMVLANSPVVSVRCALTGADDHPTDEHADVTLTFASGLTAHVVSSWQGPTEGLWDIQASSDAGVVRCEIRPSVRLEVNGDPVEVASAGGTMAMLHDFGYVGQLRSSVDDLTAGRTPMLDGNFARTVLDVICACYQSARTHEPEAVPFTGDRTRTPLQLWRP
jgi:myo-inositol 2-dehydrogenase / D-chiro-inositol 1-dehydrogenase